MARTNVAAVQSMLEDNYGKGANGQWPNLQQWVDAATLTVDQVQKQALAACPPYEHTPAELEMIERALACHYYTKSDPLYASRSTMGRSGSFINDKEQPERYKAAAINFDVSGKLHSILDRLVAGAVWLGRRPERPPGYFP